MRKHIGTIIDKSYFDVYYIIKGNNAHMLKICPYCLEEIDLGFERLTSDGRSSGFAGTLPHQCRYWVDEARHRIKVVEKITLPDDGFIFEPARRIK